MGVYLQILDLVICDWLEPPPIPWEPPAKASDGEAASEKERDGVPVLDVVFLFQVMPQRFPLYALKVVLKEGGSWGDEEWRMWKL
jgi:hypothetical protein